MFNISKLTPVQQQAMLKDLVAQEIGNQKIRTAFAINPRKPSTFLALKIKSKNKLKEFNSFNFG